MPQLWNIYHIENCRHARPSPKPKFVAIVCHDTKFMGFLINSKIHQFIKKQPDLLASQAVIDAAHHPCLGRDSYADCTELYEFEDSELSSGNYRCPIGVRSKAAIKKAVRQAKTIAPHYRNLIAS